MNESVNRRSFVRDTLAVSAAGGLLLLGASGVPAQEGARPVPRRPPPLRPEQVHAFVRAGHADLAAVRQMVAEEPGLLNATWDWGGGDWETALGGASHMGTRATAEYLVSQGARMDVFCAAMLGKAGTPPPAGWRGARSASLRGRGC